MSKKTKTFEYSAEDAEELFSAMAQGETVRAFCRRKKIPHSTCFSWINKEYPDQYARAREAIAYFWADEIIDISDDVSNDYKLNSKGDKVVDNEAIQRSKLKVETRKWLVARILPDKFSEALELRGKVNADINTNLPQNVIDMITDLKKGDNKENDPSPEGS